MARTPAGRSYRRAARLLRWSVLFAIFAFAGALLAWIVVTAKAHAGHMAHIEGAMKTKTSLLFKSSRAR